MVDYYIPSLDLQEETAQQRGRLSDVHAARLTHARAGAYLTQKTARTSAAGFSF